MAKLDDQIQTLQEKLKQLKARQLAIENRRKAIESKRERKADTRRKILAGAILLAKVENGMFDKRTFHTWLESALERDDDRALFGLPPEG
jgi:large subunit ribosomal protein L7/L12